MRILVQRHNWAIFLFFFVTVNGYCYLVMLNKFVFTEIEEEDIGNIWCHTAKATLDVLLSVFENRIISIMYLCLLATSKLRFHTVGLLFVGCRQR